MEDSKTGGEAAGKWGKGKADEMLGQCRRRSEIAREHRVKQEIEMGGGTARKANHGQRIERKKERWLTDEWQERLVGGRRGKQLRSWVGKY